MRPTWFTCLAVASLLALAPQGAFAGDKPGVAQLTVEQILEKYLEAIGGRERMSKVTSILKRGSIQSGKVQETFVIYRRAPDWWVSTYTTSRGERTSSGVDGQTHWVLLPKRDMRVLGGIAGAVPISVEFHVRSYKKARLRAMKNVGGRRAFVVELEDETIRWTHYVDAENFLLLRVDSETAFGFRGPKVLGSLRDNQFSWTYRRATSYSDWREVDGLKLPFESRTTDAPGRKSVTKINEYKLNVETDDLIFQPPPGSQKLTR